VINKQNGGVLGLFDDQLLSWFGYLVSQTFPLQEKKELWQNVLPHFRGDHSKCRHSLHEKARTIQDDEIMLTEAMTIFLSSTAKHFDRLESTVRTQAKEFLNAKRT
jgi:hypothetical protein